MRATGILRERIRELEDAERTCKVANESQRKTIVALETELADAEAELNEIKSELAETSLVAYRHGESAEKAKAEVNNYREEVVPRLHAELIKSEILIQELKDELKLCKKMNKMKRDTNAKSKNK